MSAMHSVARLAFRFTKSPNCTRTVHGGFQVGCPKIATIICVYTHPWWGFRKFLLSLHGGGGGGGGGGGNKQPGILCILAPHRMDSNALLKVMQYSTESPHGKPRSRHVPMDLNWAGDPNFLSKKCSLENVS